MICRAYRCTNEAMPDNDLCGACDEDREDAGVRMKPGSKRGSTKHNTAKKELQAKVKDAVSKAREERQARLIRNRGYRATCNENKARRLANGPAMEVINAIKARRGLL